MSRQPALMHSWNRMVASSFWDMRLSIARAATDAEYQNRIILHDNTLNLPVVARQPHPDPNYAPHMEARRVAGASRTSLGVSLSRCQEFSAPCSRLSCLLYGALTRALHELSKLFYFIFFSTNPFFSFCEHTLP